MNEADYNREFKLVIDTHNPDINITNYDYTKINNYFIGFKRTLNTKLSLNPVIISSYVNNSYFIKSSFTQVLKIENYNSLNNGSLINASANCSFTLGDVKFEGQTGNTRIFVKVVDYFSQIPNSIDLLIFDVISAIIFDYIFSLPQNQKYSHLVPVYKGCSLSFCKNTWDYNDIYYTNSMSPYNYNSLVNMNSPYARQRAIIMMTEAINSPISVKSVFTTYHTNQSPANKKIMMDTVECFHEIFEFVKYMGINYGFMHNDLHMDNLLFNPQTNKIVMIDLGRVSFSKFIGVGSTKPPELNQKCINEFKKLNYDEILSSLRINTIDDLYKHQSLFPHTIGNNTNGILFGVIYDLITLGLNFYIRSMYYIKKLYSSEYLSFVNNFSKIIEVVYVPSSNDLNLLLNNVSLKTSGTIPELVANFVDIKDNYINKLRCSRTKAHFTIILEGLFYTSLLFHFTRINNRLLDTSYRNPLMWKYFQVLINDLDNFKAFIISNLTPFIRNELSSLSLLVALFPVPGGENQISLYKSMMIPNIKSKSQDNTNPKVQSKTMNNFSLFSSSKSDSESKSKSKSSHKKISLEETAAAYKRIFDDKYDNSYSVNIIHMKKNKKMISFL